MLKVENPELDNNSMSRIIGKMWNEETQIIKQDYYWKAKQEKSEHEKLYPDYTFKPKRQKRKSDTD